MRFQRFVPAFTAVITFAMSLSALELIDRLLAEQSLKRDSTQFLYLFHDTLKDAKEALFSLPAPDEVQCEPEFVQRIVDLQFEHPAIRWISAVTSGGESCHSNLRYLDLSQFSQHRIDENLYLAVAHRGPKSDLVLIRSYNEAYYATNLDPIMFQHLAEAACSNCVGFDLAIHGSPVIRLSKKHYEGDPVVEHQTVWEDDGIEMTLVLSGNSDFLSYHSSTGLYITVPVALLLALITGSLSHMLITARQSFERLLLNAVNENEFVPFYQPIVDSRDGRLVGAEVLVRWRRPDGSFLPPADFVPLAEKSGIIVEITEKLIEQVAQDLASWNWASENRFASINIVPEHLASNRLFEHFNKLIAEYRLQASNFSLEITERQQIPDLPKARKTLQKFYDLGINLKLDDAGTGYGGFSYIQELGISTVKIDKMFVDAMELSADVKSSVLESIVAFASTSGLALIAEGVETEAQVDRLAKMGVFVIQGYVYGKPMDSSSFETWQNQ